MTKKPSAIITGDIHLREDTPVCRVDDYFVAQSKKIKWLRELQEEHRCPILDAGDLFAKSKPSHYLTQWAIRNLPNEFHTVAGNHDLPSHNISLLNKSGLGVVDAAGIVDVFKYSLHLEHVIVHPYPWKSELTPFIEETKNRMVALCHVMTFTGESPWPGCRDLPARQLLRKMKGYDLVITGHNHKSFVVESRGRILVNPGSLMRSNADQMEYKPRVFLWYAQENRVESIYVPITDGVVTRKHLDTIEDKNKRMEAFVEKLSDDLDISSSFRDNMEQYFDKNETQQDVQQLVWAALEKV